jgi:hypothetical protein
MKNVPTEKFVFFVDTVGFAATEGLTTVLLSPLSLIVAIVFFDVGCVRTTGFDATDA